jgi:hypothetical protein
VTDRFTVHQYRLMDDDDVLLEGNDAVLTRFAGDLNRQPPGDDDALVERLRGLIGNAPGYSFAIGDRLSDAGWYLRRWP